MYGVFYVYGCFVCARQKREPDPMRPQVQMVVAVMWTLGMEVRPSGKAVSVLCCLVISPAPGWLGNSDRVSLHSYGWSGTQRPTGLCLPGVGMKGVRHHCPARIFNKGK